MTLGYPLVSNDSIAASFENATVASGVGTPNFFNNMCVNNLFPAKTPVFRQLITLTPNPSKAAVECKFL
jgi:hypothetical protein